MIQRCGEENGSVKPGLHTQKAQRAKLTNINLPRVAKSTSLYFGRNSETTINYYISDVFATFSAIEKALAGRMLCGPVLNGE